MQISAAAQQDASILTSCWCLSVWRPSESPSGWRWLLWRKPGPRAWRRLPSAPRRGPSASQWGQRLGRRSYKLWENHKKNHSLKTEGWKRAMMWEVQRLHIKYEYNNIIGGTGKPGRPTLTYLNTSPSWTNFHSYKCVCGVVSLLLVPN